jgi:hypothetical protein
MTSTPPGELPPDPLAAFEALALPELEEVAGELERRMGVALRRIGERGADAPDLEGVSPRMRVAQLAAESERLTFALGAVLASVMAGDAAVARHPALVAAVSYAAPTLGALLSRLDQDRRLLTSLARQLESRLDTPAAQLEGATPRRALIEVLLVQPARCAQLLEGQAGLREV